MKQLAAKEDKNDECQEHVRKKPQGPLGQTPP